MLTLKAPAKVNLVLEVLGKRDDGYNEIRSLMQTAGLCDTLSLEMASGIEFSCTARLLENDENLVMRAALALKQSTGYTGGAKISLDKQIPWEAGLGGGSSDAATALLGLNRLWLLDLDLDSLSALGSGIGSDVAFFIYGGTCEVRGRGEEVTLMQDAPKMWFVLLKPSMLDKPGKTGRLYGLLKSQQYTGGEYCEAVRAVMLKGGQVNQSLLYNAFDGVAFDAYPGLEQYWRAFEKAGASHIHLAGSGPMLFAMFYDEREATSIHHELTAASIQSYLISSMGRGEVEY